MTMPDTHPEAAPSRTPEEREAETAAVAGPTLFSNRYVLQPYPDGSVRVVFQEQFSPDPSMPVAFRCAVYLSRPDAVLFHQLLTQLLRASFGQEPPQSNGNSKEQ